MTALLHLLSPEVDLDLGDCPYLDRWYGLPGHDPDAVCAYGCVDEPECMTCEPPGGWPSRLRLTSALDPIDAAGIAGPRGAGGGR